MADTCGTCKHFAPVPKFCKQWGATAFAEDPRCTGFARLEPGLGGISTDPSAGCGCQRCTDERVVEGIGAALNAGQSLGFGCLPRGFRYACEICGCKRCPHHEWHGFRCTNDNSVGQVGVPI